MRFTACVTTMNRPQVLDVCLRALWNSSVKPYSVIVSDNAPETELQQKNRHVVNQYPGTTYLEGPHSGVSSNRNNAFSAVTPETDFVAFLSDDICVNPDFIAHAVDRYTQMSLEQRNCTILSGVCTNELSRCEPSPLGLTFRGYFCFTDAPQVVSLPATVFPRSLFEEEQWDENIFMGQEDAEISLRARKRGYRILHCPEMRVLDICPSTSMLQKGSRTGPITDYEIYSEASRLYIGFKRYKYLSPNLFKLWAFISMYFAHMTVHLLKRGSLSKWPEIVHHSNIQQLW